ncbi:MAG: transketolase, partial [Chloroflexi bacterium]|nr:transketolase [Chloroflexota bacterium]
PKEALDHLREARVRGKKQQDGWQARLDAYGKAFPDEAALLEEAWSGELPQGWDEGLDDLFRPGDKPIATRDASGAVMNALVDRVHAFTGGSADLAPSTKTLLKDHGHYGFEEFCGHNIHFGVREHAMGAIANGMSLHGGTIPYTATFLIFSDYMRPPMRLAALMGLRVVYIFTHDSIGLGEDGPTHQPIEQLLGMRGVPNLVVLRPADATENVEAWKVAMERTNGPTVMVLSRQALPVLDRDELAPASGVQKGGYVLWEDSPNPEVILMGTGSELHIAFEAGKTLSESGVSARVVSLPSWELFDAQPREYRDSVLPPDVRARISIEAATPVGWERYVGLDGVVVGIPHFGASAPADVIYEKFGLTAQHLVDEARRLVAAKSGV